jgi:hypothetical protein
VYNPEVPDLGDTLVLALSDSLYDHESQMSQSELCCVCKKCYPEKLKECGDLTIANWGQCMFEGFLHWVHLRFCCEVRVLRTHSVFY